MFNHTLWLGVEYVWGYCSISLWEISEPFMGIFAYEVQNILQVPLSLFQFRLRCDFDQRSILVMSKYGFTYDYYLLFALVCVLHRCPPSIGLLFIDLTVEMDACLENWWGRFTYFIAPSHYLQYLIFDRYKIIFQSQSSFTAWYREL